MSSAQLGASTLDNGWLLQRPSSSSTHTPLCPKRIAQIPPASSWAALRYLAQNAGVRYLINLKLSSGDLNFIGSLYQKAISELGPYINSFELGNEVRVAV